MDTHVAGEVASRRALVVDDDFLSRRMLSDSLRSRGFSVVDVEAADAGLRILSEEGPIDLVLSDLRMPVVDGEQFVRALRARDAGGPSPFVIVVTGDVTSRLELELQQVGADAILSKRLGAPLIATAADVLLSSAAR
jgi:CheY-like chemotaxis protein